MDSVVRLIQDVEDARSSFLHTISNISEAEAEWKPAPDVWNTIDITEHLFLAEHGGIIGMWKTLHAIRKGSMERNYESIHRNMSIEQVINLTWQPKEKVPAVAAPKVGGPLSCWKISFKSLKSLLSAFGEDLNEDELRLQAHPHPISGALDFHQRLEFLRFHINRHQAQVSKLLESRT